MIGKYKDIPWDFAKFLLTSKGEVKFFYEGYDEPNDMEEGIQFVLSHN